MEDTVMMAKLKSFLKPSLMKLDGIMEIQEKRIVCGVRNKKNISLLILKMRESMMNLLPSPS